MQGNSDEFDVTPSLRIATSRVRARIYNIRALQRAASRFETERMFERLSRSGRNGASEVPGRAPCNYNRDERRYFRRTSGSARVGRRSSSREQRNREGKNMKIIYPPRVALHDTSRRYSAHAETFCEKKRRRQLREIALEEKSIATPSCSFGRRLTCDIRISRFK